MKISNTIEIRNTPENVFYWLEDPNRAMEWMTSVAETEIINQTPNRVGTTFRETIQEKGRGTEMRGVVTSFVPNKGLAFHLEGKYNAVEVHYTLHENGEITQLSQSAEIRFKGLVRLLSALFSPIFKKKISDQVRRELSTLKLLCERDVQ